LVVFVIDLAKCRVEIVGIGSALKSAWVMQCGRPLIDAGDAYLVERSLLHDLDPMCTETLSETLPTGVPTVRAPPLADVNARSGLFRPIQESCLKRMIVFGERPVAERFASSSSAPLPLRSPSTGTTNPSSSAMRRGGAKGQSRPRKRVAITQTAAPD
jgi:hypothetical protein